MPNTSLRNPSSRVHGSSRVHYRGCTLCEAMCGLEIHLDDVGEIASIRGDAKDPLSRGHICPKGVALQDIQNDPNRLRRPVRKNASGEFEEISWDEALDLVADRLGAIRSEHGRDALAVYAGNPNVHNYGSLLYGPPLMRALRTRHRYSATSVDQLPHHVVAYFCLGHMLLLPVPDLDRTDFFLVLGANPAVSNGSLMTAPDVKKRMKAIRERGGEIVVVDPRRTKTAELADEHLAIRPGTDALLLAALLRTIFEENLSETSGGAGPLASITDGLDAARAAVEPFTPERVAGATGLDADTIRDLARRFAAAKSAVAYGRMGTSTQEFGTLCQWLILLVNLATGNLDRPGGAMFTTPAVDLVNRGHGGGSFDRWRSRVRGLPEFGGELPVATLAEDILAGAEPRARSNTEANGNGNGNGRIRALLTLAGNPVLSTPNGRQLERAIESLDFRVAIDFYVNETTRHADVILPPTPPLEHDHYDLVFHVLAIRNTARYTPPLFRKAEDARHDWQILLGLHRRLFPKLPWKFRLQRFVGGLLGPSGLLDLALRTGPRGAGLLGLGEGLTLSRLKREPHGIDLGPLEPCLADRLKTKDRRIHAAPEHFVADLGRLAERLDELASPDALVLIGRRQVRSNNSWMHNYRRLMRGEDRCTLLVHPDDAERLGLADGASARVVSRVGEVTAPVEVTDTIRPGVVSLPHGFGHGRSGVRLDVAAETPGVSINDLTDETLVDALSGNVAFSGVPVRVERAAEAVDPDSEIATERREAAAGG